MWQQEIIRKAFQQQNQTNWHTLDFDYLRAMGVLERPESDRDDAYYEYEKNALGEWEKGDKFYVQYSFLYLETILEEWMNEERSCVPKRAMVEWTWREQWDAMAWEYVFELLNQLIHAEQDPRQYALFLSIKQIQAYIHEQLTIESLLIHVCQEQKINHRGNSKYRNDALNRWKNGQDETINHWFMIYIAAETDDFQPKRSKREQWKHFMGSIQETWGMQEDIWEYEVEFALEQIKEKWNALIS